MVSPNVPSAPPDAVPGPSSRMGAPAAERLTQGLVDALVGASLCLDGVERPAAGLRADEPAHRTATGRGSSAVVVRPGWGGRPTLR